MDTRHPNLKHVSETSLPAWVTPAHAGRLRDVCAAVRSRTGCDTYLDIERKEVVFGYHNEGDVRPVYAWPAMVNYHGSTYNRFESSGGCDISVDDIVYVIQIAKVDPERKAVWERDRRTAMESERRNRMGSIIGEGVRDAGRELEKKNRNAVTA